MQKRHTDRLQYFNEQSESTRKYVLPYIFENTTIDDKKCRVLEIGCGEGGNLLPFLELGHECYGVELTEWSYNNAVNFYAENPLKENLQLLNKNIYDVTPAELNGTFDIVFLRDVIEHIPEQERFMKHLKQFVAPQGVIFFAFPPWRMPFGGHQQVSRSKWVSHFPYIHLIPTTVLKWFGVSKNDINFLKTLSETGISINRFEKILKTENYKILQKTHYFINPNYEIKFGLKPRKLYKIFQIPHLKDFYTSAMYYLVMKN
jgi:2-polyprenyl-3-methyl-5-hydroxy-6-metoxy-1,4-benzoquinol methylase